MFRPSNPSLPLEQQLEGMVTLEVREAEYTAILQYLTAQNITLYHIQPQTDRLYFDILLDDFKRVQRLLRDHHLRFHICRKRGIPFLVSRYKRHKGVWAGLFCCALLTHILLSFLWNYEVIGNEHCSDAQIIALVQQYGLWPGTRHSDMEYERLEHTIELEHPEFTWIQLRTKGTTLEISVKERLAESADLADGGSIVAKADGRITELLVYTGTALVEVGDLVTAGQVLVGGWDYPQRVRNSMGVFEDVGIPYAVHAKSNVRGEQKFSAIGTCALTETWLTKTGITKRNTTLLWKEHTLFSIGPDASPYRYSAVDTEQYSLFQWGRWQCPLILCTTIYHEQIAVQRSFTPDEAYQTAVERARRQLKQRMPQDSVLVRESCGMHRNTQEGVIQAEVLWIVDAPIGRMSREALPSEAFTAE